MSDYQEYPNYNLPFKGGVKRTQPFGKTEFSQSPAGQQAYSGLNHEGIDLISDDESAHPEVLSTCDGTVIVDNDSFNGKPFNSYGCNVIIQEAGTNRAWYYCHLDSNKVSYNQTIKKGDVIGYMGGSGAGYRSAWGSHLHLGLALLSEQGTRLNQDNGTYGFIDPAQEIEKANRVEQVQAPAQQPAKNEPPKMTTKQGLQELLRYYPEFTPEIENGWPIARFDIDGAGEGLKMVAEQVLQPMYNRNANLQVKLQNLKATFNSSDILPVKKNEQNLESQNPIQAEIRSDQSYLGTDTVGEAELKTKIVETNNELVQSVKAQEIKELVANPYVVKAETPLWKSKTILTNLGGLGAVVSALGSFNIPALRDAMGQVIGTDYCNYLLLVIVILICTNIASIVYKITDRKVLNQENLLKLISFGQSTLATSQDLITRSEAVAQTISKINISK